MTSDAIKTIVSRIQIVYYAQLATTLITALVAYGLIASGQMGPPDHGLALVLQKVMIVAVPLSMGAAYFMFRVYMRRITGSALLADKLKVYAAAVLIRAALLELPGLFLSAAALITAQILFLTVVPLVVIVFLFLRPAKTAIAMDLDLSPAQRDLL